MESREIANQVKVLVVDDEELIGTSLKRAFEKVGGYSVECVFTGNAAIKHLSENTYDIVVTDLNLPDYKDLEIVKEIRNLELHIPLIVMSANYPESIAEDVQNQEIFRCINKPFEIDDVITGVAEALR